MTLEAHLQRIWYGRSPLRFLLWPASVLFGLVVCVRRALFARRDSGRVGAPVVVVGNITVGGTGKTPLVIWLARRLTERGWRIGIVLRGYGGEARDWPREVSAIDDPRLVGDEAVLLARNTAATVVAGPDRRAAARRAIELGAQIVVSDDGLQHYRLARDCEFAVLDARRLLGNGLLLPAGPLREPAGRLATVDCVLVKHSDDGDAVPAPAAGVPGLSMADTVAFHVMPGDAWSLTTGERRPLEQFRGGRVHALAGVGHPEAFFTALERRGLTIERHAPGDHARLGPQDLDFGDRAPVLMTEKDAVKCRPFADARYWAVTAVVSLAPRDAERLLGTVEATVRERLASLRTASPALHGSGDS